MMNIKQYLESQKTKVDEALSRHLLHVSEGCPAPLQEAMEHSLKAGGKRIRPILAIAAAAAVGEVLEPVLSVALALEMIHTFSLIHDDLPAMDNDDLRRGRPTNHKVFGEGIAILAGDGLLAQSFYLLCHAGLSTEVKPSIILDCIRDIAFATGPCGMVGGQVLDLKAQGTTQAPEDLEKIHRYKTGRLICASVTCGARIGSASPDQLESLKIYGENIGLAFQIADDILNVEGKSLDLGKGVGSDKKNRKATYPGVLGLEASKRKAASLAEEAVQSLKKFDAAADPLRELARYIVSRKS